MLCFVMNSGSVLGENYLSLKMTLLVSICLKFFDLLILYYQALCLPRLLISACVKLAQTPYWCVLSNLTEQSCTHLCLIQIELYCWVTEKKLYPETMATVMKFVVVADWNIKLE